MLALAAVGAGAINALAGGGSILTFPALIAAGIPPIAANVTNSIALCPGYVGGVIGQWRDLKGQQSRLIVLTPMAVIGGLAGAWLILSSREDVFEALVPWLLIGGCALLGIQDWIRATLQRGRAARGLGWSLMPVLVAAIYGGYFGAGLSVIYLAVLGLTLDDSLTRLNALKQALSLATNVAAAAWLATSPLVIWPAVAVMSVGAIAGGAIGGRLASIVAPRTLRFVVIAIGIGVAILFLVRA